MRRVPQVIGVVACIFGVAVLIGFASPRPAPTAPPAPTPPPTSETTTRAMLLSPCPTDNRCYVPNESLVQRFADGHVKVSYVSPFSPTCAAGEQEWKYAARPTAVRCAAVGAEGRLTDAP